MDVERQEAMPDGDLSRPRRYGPPVLQAASLLFATLKPGALHI